MIEPEGIKDQIYANMQLKSTVELQQIWEDNDRSAWSNTAFQVVRKILLQRTGEIPLPQRSYEPPAVPHHYHTPIFRLPSDRYVRAGMLGIYALIPLLLLFTLISPAQHNPRYQDLFLLVFVLGIITSVSLRLGAYTYRAWTKDAESFRQWMYEQSPYYIHMNKGHLKRMRWLFLEMLYPDWALLWGYRLTGPIILVGAIALGLSAIGALLTSGFK